MKKDKLIAGTLAFTMTFSGCSTNNSSYNENNYYILYQSTESESIQPTEEINNDDIIIEETASTDEVLTQEIFETVDSTEEHVVTIESEEIIATTSQVQTTIPIETTEPITTETYEITEEVLNEDELIEVLENQEQLIMNEAVNGDKESLKEKLDEYFSLTIGFLFCDQPIKGKTLDELTTSAKIKIISITNNINDTIEIYYPDYKITIKEKYTDVKVWTLDKFKSASSCLKEKLEEKIGTENYNELYSTYESAKTKIKDIGSAAWDKAVELKDKGVEKIKDWWENKTNN